MGRVPPAIPFQRAFDISLIRSPRPFFRRRSTVPGYTFGLRRFKIGGVVTQSFFSMEKARVGRKSLGWAANIMFSLH